MTTIRDGMPLLARHEGEWIGTYIHLDAHGTEIDRHASHLVCTFPEAGEFDYYQVNRYSWEDGRVEERHFPAHYANHCIYWDNELIQGQAREVDGRTIVLNWNRTGEPGIYLYEMIQLSADGVHRARTWHWFRDDRLFQRTLIAETRLDRTDPSGGHGLR